MQLHIKVNAQGVIEDAKFKCFGCGSAIASSSLATEWIKGKSIDDAEAIEQAAVLAAAASDPVSDLRGEADFKRDLVRVLTKRALRSAGARAQGKEA